MTLHEPNGYDPSGGGAFFAALTWGALKLALVASACLIVGRVLWLLFTVLF